MRHDVQCMALQPRAQHKSHSSVYSKIWIFKMNLGKKKSIKQLESYLQDVENFSSPKVGLEQYITPPHIAAQILNTIDLTYDDTQDKLVADLGCGTGMLTAASILSGARMVVGFEVDESALQLALDTLRNFYNNDDDTDDPTLEAYKGSRAFEFILADIESKDRAEFWDRWNKTFDTVIMNPPFGTKHNQGLDMVFLKRAIDLSKGRVYSLHKTSTRQYIANKVEQWEVVGKPVAQICYNIDSSYKFHKRKSVDIDVDLWQIMCS